MSTAALPAAGSAHQAVTEIVNRSGTSFALGMKILPKARREAMFAIYAFCREVDDIADEPGALEDKLAALDAWRANLDEFYSARRVHGPIMQALARPIEAYDLPREEFLALIDGMEMDARGPIVAPDWQTLTLYCRRVAGAVGLLSIRAFGAGTDAKTVELSIALAEALQLTNILRDLDEDAADGRLYLPREELEAASIEPVSEQPKDVLRHPRLPMVAAAVAERIERNIATVDRLLPHCNRRALRPALAMLGAYEVIYRRLKQRGWERIAEPLRLPKALKLIGGLRRAYIS